MMSKVKSRQSETKDKLLRAAKLQNFSKVGSKNAK
jgi:hypothetical protein